MLKDQSRFVRFHRMFWSFEEQCHIHFQKRRSARNTKRKKYLDEVDLNLSDDDTLDVDTEAAVSATVNATGGAVTKPVPFLSSVVGACCMFVV